MSLDLEKASGAAGVEAVARRARGAALALATLSTETKNAALAAVRQALEANQEAILAANLEDKNDSGREVEAGRISRALFNRLELGGKKFAAMLAGVEDVIKLEDPVGKVSLATQLDDGLNLYRVSCPLGVLGVIFEARPEAAVQIATLALKSSNAVILKGGREASRSNAVLVDTIREALGTVDGVPVDAVQLVSTREEVREMLDLDRWIDLIIPRGSNELVRSIQEATRIPVLGHADGLCLIYLDRDADVAKAEKIVVDSKTHYPAACNAVETLLVHRDRLEDLLPPIGKVMADLGVDLRAEGAMHVLGVVVIGGPVVGTRRKAAESEGHQGGGAGGGSIPVSIPAIAGAGIDPDKVGHEIQIAVVPVVVVSCSTVDTLLHALVGGVRPGGGDGHIGRTGEGKGGSVGRGGELGDLLVIGVIGIPARIVVGGCR